MNTLENSSMLTEVYRLYTSGLYLQAFEASKPLGPLALWKDPQAQVLGGRLANCLGGPRLGRLLHRLAYQQTPEDHKVTVFYALVMLGRRGLWETFRWAEKQTHMASAPNDLRADWLSIQAQILAGLRDFQPAEKLIDEALRLCPERAWIWVERSSVYEMEDRLEDAVKAARRALELQPWYRPAVQTLAYQLVQLNQDAEAIELLEEATRRLESGDVLAQLAALYLELKQYPKAGEIFERIEPYYPLIKYSKEFPKWLACRRADVAYYCGDIEKAIEQANLSDSVFHKRIATRLADKSLEDKRVHLPVKFVHQHHATCAPATLATISDYWGKPAPHLEIAEEICYDGTPAHSERRWAIKNGYETREFRVTWETAVALIDRGVPFTLTTIDPGNGHLQSVIGYDNRRGTLIIQDPGERHAGEGAGVELVEHYASTGPRGMAFVPMEEKARLDGIEFPDAKLYDYYFQLEIALESHRRDKAAQFLEKLKSKAPDHLLTWRAIGTLANYDTDVRTILQSNEALLAKYPKDVNYLLAKLSCLQDLNLREERLAWLKEQVSQPDCNPLFELRYASELSEDAREYPTVEYLLRRVIRYRPHDGQALNILGMVRWDQGKRDEALQLYRFAACVESKNESLSRSYFHAARILDKADQALELIQDRFRRAGALSTMPARTLCWAYEQLDRNSQSFEVLDKALQQHPDDGSLLLYAATHNGRYGSLSKAEQLLLTAAKNSREADWLRAKASLCLSAGNLRKSLKNWLRVVDRNPLDASAHESIATLLVELEDATAAVNHLQSYVDRFPHNLPLSAMLIEYMRDDSEKSEAALRQFMEKNPNNPWGHRELALALYSQNQFDQALVELDLAEQLEKNNHFVAFLRGKIYENKGQLDEARKHLRTAIARNIDFEPALHALINTCDTKEERQRELLFVEEQLSSQVSFGEGILAYRTLARSTLTPEQLLDALKKMHDVRPDLWHAWSAVIAQLMDMKRLDDALQWAQDATLRFSMLTQSWIDLSSVCYARKDIPEQIKALKRAWELSPSASEPARMLAEAYETQGDLERAEKTLLRSIALEPKEPRNYGFLGSLLWNCDRKDEAFEQLEKAVRLAPRYQWAWDTLRQYCEQAGQPERFVKAARDLTQQHPDDANAWYLLGDLLQAPEFSEEAIAATRKAIDLRPRMTEAYSQLAFFLARDGDFEAALKACRPHVYGEAAPLELQSRAAWVHTVSGDLARGIELMLHVVEQDPEYYWAWSQLSDWTEGVEEYKDLHYKAVSNIARITPNHHVAWGMMGAAELDQENPPAAKECFQRAIAIAPDYLPAVRTLFDMQLRDEEFDAASETIQATRESVPAAWTLSFETRLAAGHNNRERTLALLKELAQTESEDHLPLDACGLALWQKSWGPDAENTLIGLLDSPKVQPAAAYVWVNLCSTLKLWDRCEKRIEKLNPGTEVWASATRKFIQECIDEKEPKRLRQFLAKHQKAMQHRDDTWFSVGEAYNDLEDYKALADWLYDWQNRPECDDWAVVLLIMSLLVLRRDDEARQAAETALKLREDRPAADTWRIWVMAHELIHGDLPRAQAMVASLAGLRTTSFFRGCYEVLSQWSEVLCGSGSYSQGVKAIRAALDQSQPLVKSDKLMKRYCLVIQRRLAELRGKKLSAAILGLKLKFAK